MKVRAVRSFAGVINKVRYRYIEGEEFDLPKDVDWLKAGLVLPVKSSDQETATPAKPRRRAKK